MQQTIENDREAQPSSQPSPLKVATEAKEPTKREFIPAHRQDEIGGYYNDPMGR